MQGAIRLRSVGSEEDTVHALKLAFRCMEADMGRYVSLAPHAQCAWRLASAEVDNLLRSCSQFPYEIALASSMEKHAKVAFIDSAISTLRRVHKQEWDVPVLLKMVLIDVLSRDQTRHRARSECEALYKLLHGQEEEAVPVLHKEELLLNVRLLAVELKRKGVIGDGLGPDELHRSCQLALEELSATGYDGKLEGTRHFRR